MTSLGKIDLCKMGAGLNGWGMGGRERAVVNSPDEERDLSSFLRL